MTENLNRISELKAARIPAPVYEGVALQVLAVDIRKGDTYRVSPTSVKTVETVKIGTKRVTVLDEAGKEMAYLLLSDVVQVGREVETKESKDARDHAERCVRVIRNRDFAQNTFDEAVVKINERFSIGVVEYASMTWVAEAQANLAIWESVLFHAEANNIDEADAAVSLAESFQRQLMDRYPGESRSTSQMSNLLEDITWNARAKFVRNQLHYGW